MLVPGGAIADRAWAADSACDSDRACGGRFCDNRSCAAAEGVYGAACTPAHRTKEGFLDGKLHQCGAYLCIEARCRSCTTDEQCRTELGAPRCVALAGLPGKRCGR
jgi:hypothetical protein